MHQQVLAMPRTVATPCRAIPKEERAAQEAALSRDNEGQIPRFARLLLLLSLPGGIRPGDMAVREMGREIAAVYTRRALRLLRCQYAVRCGGPNGRQRPVAIVRAHRCQRLRSERGSASSLSLTVQFSVLTAGPAKAVDGAADRRSRPRRSRPESGRSSVTSAVNLPESISCPIRHPHYPSCTADMPAAVPL